MKIAILTSGGLAPCLSSAIGGFVQRYTELDRDVEIITYLNGYQGLLLGQSRRITEQARSEAYHLLKFGGSPIGNSRVKLSNVKDCENKGLIHAGQNPFEVAAHQLMKDQVDILHTIGGDDTSTTAAELAHFLAQNNYPLHVVGLPKTIDNDIFPIRQSLGATTAAEQGAIFFENVVHEHSANSNMLIIHEIMGRNCGWLTYATAACYTSRLIHKTFAPTLGFPKEKFEIHGIYIPEIEFDLEREVKRLRPLFDRLGCLNLFVSEGACVTALVKELEKNGEKVARDAFGHIKLDHINAGKWVGEQLSKALGAQKMLVQKSGYFARSAAPNAFDLYLIQSYVDFAVECAFKGISGLVGHDETQHDTLRCIEFERVKGGKLLDINNSRVQQLLQSIHK
ncbi:MAG: pyrophosphate--fructose-6-phosphate 1-phosphotransferase [Puniceicoccales bacterium]|jgi:pyrophosphate--fructose-6-phosphate 1-phosphotransferase|nr:pyrophosphate--fructose-6-phosphate 1-phosphotransferase [Puniceicoccales bacterium]